MQQLLDEQLRLRPQMRPQDAVKLIFQATLGCGHLLADEAVTEERIRAEEAALSPCKDEPLTESLGADYVRLNLRPAMAHGLEPRWIARMMKLSCEPPPVPTRQDAAVILAALNPRTLDENALRQGAQRLANDPGWLPGHTVEYRAAYHPAYRVIGAKWAWLLPALCAIRAQWHKPRLLVTLDGPCCGGKTTMAEMLSRVLDAAVIHMDDFYVPHAQKTAERLSMPGGNADVERLCSELLEPWLMHGEAAYRPYCCREDRLLDPISIPARKVTVIEGCYSNLPAIRSHADVRLFLRIDADEQRQRLLMREGAAGVPAFERRWLPLEQAYFTAYSLPDAGCTVMTASSFDPA